MKELLEFLVKSIVDKPEEVAVSEIADEEIVTLKIKAAKEDIGKVIGRGGKVIKSLRNLVHILAVKEGKKVSVEILEENP